MRKDSLGKWRFEHDTPQGLLNAVFYYNGVNLALRGGDGHKGLKLSQMVIKAVQNPDDPPKEIDCLVYMEHGSKNRPGNSKQVNLESKVVTQFSKPKLGNKCHVQLVKKYISKLPSLSRRMSSTGNQRYVLASASLPDHVWYDSVPIGHNTLKTKMKEIVELAGLKSEAVSNHSLQATGISRLSAAEVPDKLIMERSGHLSAEGVHSYKRNTVQQEKAVSSLLSSPNKLFGDAMKPVPVQISTGQQQELAIYWSGITTGNEASI